MQLQQGTLLQGGRYKIIKKIGQGSFGITYLAFQNGLDREVVIKEFFMKDDCCRDPATSYVTVYSESKKREVLRFKKMFKTEAVRISQLEHVNIIRIYDSFEENDTAYYVMEYIEGGSLNGYISENGARSEMESLYCIRKIAHAVGCVHDNEMLHLDIKPDNILRRHNTELVLIDFGASKLFDQSGCKLTTTPVLLTQGYAPIEQSADADKSTMSPATDIYALGATLYKLLTGTTPPRASEVLNSGLPPLPAHISAKTRSAVTQAMQPLRANRPQSIAAFLKLLGDDDRPKRKPISIPEGKLVGVLAALCVIVGLGLYAYKGYTNYKEEQERIRIEQLAIEAAKQAEEARIAQAEQDSLAHVAAGMVYVEGGTFQMGSTSGASDEKPIHSVTVSSFWIGKYEVTQGEWESVMGSNPSKFKGSNKPVEQVSWYDCVKYCNAKSRADGREECYSIDSTTVKLLSGKNGYRLPTEAEWEYAARGGDKSQGYTYSGSDNLSSVGWHDENSGYTTHEVGAKLPNELGIYDMSGNVWEWCWDWYSSSYPSTSQTNPTGATSGSCRVIRGGCYYYDARNCRSADRDYSAPTDSGYDIGLRLVRRP